MKTILNYMGIKIGPSGEFLLPVKNFPLLGGEVCVISEAQVDEKFWVSEHFDLTSYVVVEIAHKIRSEHGIDVYGEDLEHTIEKIKSHLNACIPD